MRTPSLPDITGLNGGAEDRGDPAADVRRPWLGSPPGLGDATLRTEGGAVERETGSSGPDMTGRDRDAPAGRGQPPDAGPG
eukprot:4906853-Pyramimonas_sp.AAC.1